MTKLASLRAKEHEPHHVDRASVRLLHKNLEGVAREFQVSKFEVSEELNLRLNDVSAEILDFFEFFQVAFAQKLGHSLFIETVLVDFLFGLALDVFPGVVVDKYTAVGCQLLWAVLVDRVY